MSLNKVMIIGNLGKDPEMRLLKNGDAVANFSLAVNESYKDREGKRQEKTEWVPVVVFGKQSDFCKNYLHKGSLVYVEGRLQTRDWTDKENVKRYKTEVVAQAIRFVGPKPGGKDPEPQGKQMAMPPEDETDLPF